MGVDWRLRGLQFWTSKRNAIKTKQQSYKYFVQNSTTTQHQFKFYVILQTLKSDQTLTEWCPIVETTLDSMAGKYAPEYVQFHEGNSDHNQITESVSLT